MLKTLRTSATAVVLAIFPMASHAATTDFDLIGSSTVFGSETFTPGGFDLVQTFTFTALENLTVKNFRLYAVGGTPSNIETITWTLSGNAPNAGPTAFIFGGAGFDVSPFSLNVIDAFSLTLDGTGVVDDGAAVGFTFKTVASAPVPAAVPCQQRFHC